MDNQALTRVAEEYERLQRENRLEEDRRRQEIARKHPELDRLLTERHQMILRSVRGAFSGAVPADPEQAMTEYNRKIGDLLAEKAKNVLWGVVKKFAGTHFCFIELV